MLMSMNVDQLCVSKSRSSNNNNFQSVLKMFNNSSSKRADGVDESPPLSSLLASASFRTGKNFVVEQQNHLCNNSSVDDDADVQLEQKQNRSNFKIHQQKNRVENIAFDQSSTTMTTVSKQNSTTTPMNSCDQNNSSSSNEFSQRRRSTTMTDVAISSLDLKDRYVSLENNFNDYRRKTNSLLLKKDAHISRLQERLNSFVENSNVDSTLHMIVAERDSLRLKLEQLEIVYSQEKSSWMSELETMRKNMESQNIVEREQEQEDLEKHTFFDNEKMKCDCDFLRQELDRYRRELNELQVKTESIINMNNARLDSLAKQFNVELTTKNDELKSLNERLTSTLIERDDAMKNLEKFQLDFDLRSDQNDAEQKTRLTDENQMLKRQLYEANEYFESMDVESEQQITVLINQIDEMHEVLESKQRDYIVLTNELMTKNQENEQLQQKLKANDVQSSRQMDIIESLRDEFDKQKDKIRETIKERDDLLIRNASLTHEVDFTKRQSQKERENIHQQLTLAGQELDEYKEKLRQNEIQNESSIVLANLTSKISNLEEHLKSKQDTIDVLEQRLSNVKRLLRKNLLSKSSKSEFDLNSNHTSSSLAFQSPMKKFRVMNAAGDGNEYRNAINRLFPNAENDPERIARVFGSLLRLSTDEEQLVRNFLQQKSSTQTLSTIGL